MVVLPNAVLPNAVQWSPSDFVQFCRIEVVFNIQDTSEMPPPSLLFCVTRGARVSLLILDVTSSLWYQTPTGSLHIADGLPHFLSLKSAFLCFICLFPEPSVLRIPHCLMCIPPCLQKLPMLTCTATAKPVGV